MDRILTIFRSLADPTRLRILYLVLEMELSVGELAQILDQSQPRISRHVRILTDAKLIARSKEGSWVFLRPGDAPQLDVLRRLMRARDVTASAQIATDTAKLGEVRRAREEMASAYFADHANKWDAIRSLHIPEAEVEQAMMALVKENRIGRLLDIGTGTARMVELFAPVAQSITAVDKSPEMLRVARAKLDSEASAKTELKLADFNALPLDNSQFDSVVLHQVLHYAQQPGHALAEAARVLVQGGVMVIVDFAAHEREELRTVHAHARLGFGDDSIARWLRTVEVDLVQTRTLRAEDERKGGLTVKIWIGRKTGVARIGGDRSEPAVRKSASG